MSAQNVIRKYAMRVERAWNILRVQGPRRFAVAGTVWIRSRLGKPTATNASYLAKKQRVDGEFDAQVGVATGGIEYLYDLTIDSRNARFGNNHIAVDPAEFAIAMARVDIDLKSATFVDLGSGRGRALILAAELPFVKIVGVEFARELHDATVVNIRHAFPTNGDSNRIISILGDAAEFEYPDTPLVVYLFNSFDAPIVAAVARKALESWRANPRPVRVVYLNPVFAREWRNAGWQLLEEGIGRAMFAPPAH